MDDRLAGLLGMRVPILSAPIGGAATPELVAAVSGAGGLGTIPLWGDAEGVVRDRIAAIQARTDRPFAVNLNLDWPWEEAIDICAEAGVRAVSLFWGAANEAAPRAREAGLAVIVTVGKADEARAARDHGAQAVVAQGWEAGGHVWGGVATMALIPAVVEAVDIPVIAAGGIADGRGLAAALSLGASAAWIGTRFLASEEASVHVAYRARVLGASAEEAEWHADLYDEGWPDAPHRTLRNATSRAWDAAGRPPRSDRPGRGQEVGHAPDGRTILRYQSYTPQAGAEGDVEAMSLWAGQGVSLVREVQPAAEIVREIHRDARAALARADAGL